MNAPTLKEIRNPSPQVSWSQAQAAKAAIALLAEVESEEALRFCKKLMWTMRLALDTLREYIESVGGCDHSVGICVCGDWEAYNNANAVLDAMAAKLESKNER